MTTEIAKERARRNTANYRLRHKDTIRLRRKERYAAEKEATVRRRSTSEGWAKSTIPRLRHRAKVDGIEFNIDWTDILRPEFCPVLGIPLIAGIGEGKAMDIANSPSVDRIDNSKGYVKGNVCVISVRANLLKKDATLDEIRSILHYMENNL